MKIQCPVCKKSTLNRLLTKNSFTVVQCPNCHFGQLENPPLKKELEKIYSPVYFTAGEMQQQRADTQKKLNFLKRYLSPPAEILDFGCGLGEFLDLAKKNRFKVCGYDISRYAAQFISTHYQIPVSFEKLSEKVFPPNSFDAITAFDVIEHVDNFPEVIELFNLWLKPGGKIFITTPNLCSWDAKIFQKKWYGFSKIPQHINYFSPQALRLTLKKSGFQNIEIKNWGFYRTLEFIIQSLFEEQSSQSKTLIDHKKTSSLGKVLLSLTRTLRINQKELFVPAIEMIGVAQKRI